MQHLQLNREVCFIPSTVQLHCALLCVWIIYVYIATAVYATTVGVKGINVQNRFLMPSKLPSKTYIWEKITDWKSCRFQRYINANSLCPGGVGVKHVALQHYQWSETPHATFKQATKVLTIFFSVTPIQQSHIHCKPSSCFGFNAASCSCSFSFSTCQPSSVLTITQFLLCS